jgi:hypothetical protein
MHSKTFSEFDKCINSVKANYDTVMNQVAILSTLYSQVDISQYKLEETELISKNSRLKFNEHNKIDDIQKRTETAIEHIKYLQESIKKLNEGCLYVFNCIRVKDVILAEPVITKL